MFHDDGAAVWADAGLGRLLDAIRARVGTLTAALSPAAKLPLLDHRLGFASGEVLALPELPSIGRGFGKFAACRRVIREVERRSDAVIVQLPFEAPLALFGARTPRLYHVCADIWAFANRSTRFAGWKRLPALAIGGLIDRMQGHLFQRNEVRVVTNGGALLAHFGNPPGRAVVSSTICDTEILSVARSRPTDAPFRVLYVGYIRHEKGTDLLIDAFARVLDTLPTAELEVVGARDGGSQAMGSRFERALENLQRRGAVRFLGSRNFGPELFQCLADADVLVVPYAALEGHAHECSSRPAALSSVVRQSPRRSAAFPRRSTMASMACWFPRRTRSHCQRYHASRKIDHCVSD